MDHNCELEKGVTCWQMGLSRLILQFPGIYDNQDDGCHCSDCSDLQINVNYCPKCGFKDANE